MYEEWEAYDTWRVWWLPPKLRDAGDHFDKEAVLGTDEFSDAKRAVQFLGGRRLGPSSPGEAGHDEVRKRLVLST